MMMMMMSHSIERKENETNTAEEKILYGSSNEFDSIPVLASDQCIPIEPRYQLVNCADFIERDQFLLARDEWKIETLLILLGMFSSRFD
jgi:hypothetical protein